MFPQSVRARLTLWYTLVLSLPLGAFAVLSYWSFAGALRARTDAFLSDALTVFANELVVERRQFPGLEEAIRTTVDEVRFRDLDILVFDGEGHLVASSGMSHGDEPARFGRPTLPSEIVETIETWDVGDSGVGMVNWSGSRYRVRVQPLEVPGGEFSLAGAYPFTEVEETLRTIRHLFFIAIPLFILLAGSGGWFLARRSLMPIAAIASRAAEIGATTLHERLPVVADDELGKLATVLNDLLDRLERSFAQQRRFMADASHELRSPTAILRSEADVILSREHRTEAEYRESIGVMQNAVQRLTRVVDDLFLLARSDGGQPVVHSVPLYLDEVVRDTVRVVHPLAEEKGVLLEHSEMVETPYHGDPDLLGRLLLNLLDNAIKHSLPGGQVQVAMAVQETVVEIRVIDSGPGIPQDAQKRIFERFFRVDRARSRTDSALTSGAGLGLAIARRIAEMHGGRLYLASSRPGRTEFLLVLPVSGVRNQDSTETPPSVV